jgi:hypothetical protein
MREVSDILSDAAQVFAEIRIRMVNVVDVDHDALPWFSEDLDIEWLVEIDAVSGETGDVLVFYGLDVLNAVELLGSYLDSE